MRYARLKVSFLLPLFFYAGFSGCRQNNHPMPETAAMAPDLNHVNIHLPEAAGYQAFALNCLICHSAAYVQNQPDLPEKTWEGIVTKMQKTFGAPVADSSIREIVQYLVTIKGKR